MNDNPSKKSSQLSSEGAGNKNQKLSVQKKSNTKLSVSDSEIKNIQNLIGWQIS
ncbi:MAG: hypothetical protein JST55_02770 [Bacteroidetes bacterium]|nr:hypothetical protein [Bacteroidota bacterium]